MKKTVIIDGNSLINRAFYALPLLTNEEGLFSNAVYGFANMLTKIMIEVKPDFIAVCFDYGKHTFRHDVYSEYKGTRKGMPEELRMQMPLLKEMLTKMNITYIEKEGFEADDLIGSLARKFNGEKIIISGDKDLFQLINDSTTVWHTKKGITDYGEMTTLSLKETMNISPSQVVELKALMGDASDNIKGVQGVGEKTALNLINEYTNIENLYDNIDKIKGKLKEKLETGKEDAFMSKWLATIKTDVPLEEINQEMFTYDFPFNQNVLEFFKRFDFKSIIKRSSLFTNKKVEEEKSEEIILNNIITINSVDELENLVEKIKNQKIFSIHFSNSVNVALNDREEYLIKVAQDLISFDSLDLSQILITLKEVLEDDKIQKVVYDSKDLKHYLNKLDINLKNVVFDVSLAEYLIKCGIKISENLESLLKLKNINIENYASGLFILQQEFINELQNLEMLKLYEEVELPLVDCLYNMEITGVKLDRQELEKLKQDFNEQILELTQKIHDLAGKKFNINSPKQLGEILFDFIGLPNRKKGSTANEVLVNLLGYHPIIEYIINYRKVFKIAGYVQAFLEKMDKKDEKLHTIYQQKLTTTGRLSSIEPNLQNVPVRDEIGKNLRKAFISQFENGYLVSSDYSQIELKLLANFSKDEKLLSAYKQGIDIHTKTASEIMGIEKEKVTMEMRKKAKAINFGIIYGISEYGLSESIHSSVKEAKYYMENYFNSFPSIKTYLDSLVDEATQKGYSITLFNRRRKIPEITSSNYNMRLFGKRVAMNMPLQGTASDIIKIAMNKVFNELKNQNLQSKLILQIHDELIIDTHPNELEKVKNILKECMESVVDFEIPLTCDISYGKNWLEAL